MDSCIWNTATRSCMMFYRQSSLVFPIQCSCNVHIPTIFIYFDPLFSPPYFCIYKLCCFIANMDCLHCLLTLLHALVLSPNFCVWFTTVCILTFFSYFTSICIPMHSLFMHALVILCVCIFCMRTFTHFIYTSTDNCLYTCYWTHLRCSIPPSTVCTLGILISLNFKFTYNLYDSNSIKLYLIILCIYMFQIVVIILFI